MLPSYVRIILLIVCAAYFSVTAAMVVAEETPLPPPETGQETPPPELWAELPPLPPLEVEAEEEAHTIWTCSMHPNIQLPEFGQCPICFMDLIEVALDSGSKLTNLRQLVLDENARKLAQVEVTEVKRTEMVKNVRMVGKVDFDETLVSSITAWINGRIDKQHVAYTGSHVRAGQPMAEIYSPELLAAQAEFIESVAATAKLDGSGNVLLKKTIERTRAAARKKLRLLGLTDAQINEVVANKNPSDHVTLTAPISGIVINKGVTEGMYVKTGTPIYTIADLSKLWIVLEAYESDLHAIYMGQEVEFSAEAFPGRHFTGTVAYIDPLVNNKTRTVKVRLNIDNPDYLLKPGMFVRAVARSKLKEKNENLPLLIPASAPLFTGKRAIVYVELPDKQGAYEGREIVLGSRHGEFYEVVSGLDEGELVVSRGNFKIDSAIQIQARPSMMNPYIAKETSSPAEAAPLFASKLNLLNQTFVQYSQAVHQGDRELAGRFLQTFEKILGSIQTDFLDPEIKLDWLELSMALGADLVLINESENNEELLRAYAEMALHFHQVRTRFQLPEPVLARQGSDELRMRLGRLLDNYLVLQRNLADDAPEKSLAEVPAIARSIEKFTAELTAEGYASSSSIAGELAEAVSQMEKSSSLKELRIAFYPLSRGLIEAVSTFGVDGDHAVYEHYCPMAFNDTGANWLDTSERINNPYFGDEMLRCGEVTNQLKLED